MPTYCDNKALPTHPNPTRDFIFDFFIISFILFS